MQELEVLFAERPWIKLALNCDLKASVCVLDTGPVWKYPLKSPTTTPNSKLKLTAVVKSKEHLNCVNHHEIFIVTSLIDALLNVNHFQNNSFYFFLSILLLQGGVSKENIGVIAPYKLQVLKISSKLANTGVEVSTVDQFQGRDKNIIIYSCTRSKDTSTITKRTEVT